MDGFERRDPAELSMPLRALWYDCNGDWQRAHEAAQADEQDPDSAWVHAYLHRKEGDAFNAAYWYRRARREQSTMSLDDERSAIIQALLSDAGAVDAQP